MFGKTMKIGLIRFSSLGDVILTTGIIRELKREFDDAEITMITSSRYLDIFRSNPHLNKNLVIEGKSFSDVSRLIKKVRNERFDILADLHLNPRSLLVSCASRSRKKLRYSKCRRLRSMMVSTKNRQMCGHVVDRYFAPFEKLGLKSTNLKPEIWIDGETRRSMNATIGNGNMPLVAVSPGAKRATKRWLAEKYGRLCRSLIETEKAKVIIVGDKEDTQIAHKIRNIAGKNIIDLTGKTSLLQLAAVLRRSSVLVTNDSGPMHMAAATGTPVVAIFGPTVPEFGFSPLGERDRVIEKQLPCRPCSLHGSEQCSQNGFKCMRDVTAEEVIEAVSHVLNG